MPTLFPYTTLFRSPRRRLAIRVEVHVALGTRSTNPGQIAAQQLQAVAIGSDRPLGSATPTDPVNERIDFIKAQQGGTP